MKLSADLRQNLSDALKSQHQRSRHQLGEPYIRVDRLDPAPMAPRVKILPCSEGVPRRASYASVRSVSATGIVLVDTAYWLDGEQFLIHLPAPAGVFGRPRGILCNVTHWSPLSAGLFVVSASFARLIGPVEGQRRLRVSSLPLSD